LVWIVAKQAESWGDEFQSVMNEVYFSLETAVVIAPSRGVQGDRICYNDDGQPEQQNGIN